MEKEIKEDVRNENLNINVEFNEEQLEQIKDFHFANQEDDLDEDVTEEEIKGLAVNLVELEEAHYKLVENYNQLEEELEELQKTINDLKVVEEEE